MRRLVVLLAALAAGACASRGNVVPADAVRDNKNYYGMRSNYRLIDLFRPNRIRIATDSFRASEKSRIAPREFAPATTTTAGAATIEVFVSPESAKQRGQFEQYERSAHALAQAADSGFRRIFSNREITAHIKIYLAAHNEKIDHRFALPSKVNQASFALAAYDNEMLPGSEQFMSFAAKALHETYHAALIVSPERIDTSSIIDRLGPIVPNHGGRRWAAYAKSQALEEAAAGLFSQCAFLSIADDLKPATAVTSQRLPALSASERAEGLGSISRVLGGNALQRLQPETVPLFGYLLADVLWRDHVGDAIYISDADPAAASASRLCVKETLADPKNLMALVDPLLNQ